MTDHTATKKKARGRPSSFNREDLLEQVMELFWDRGYAALSFNEIAAATGLTRASLYNSFKTKEALFAEALNRYFKRSPDHILDDMGKGAAVGNMLRGMLMQATENYASDPKRRGCFAVNSINELMAEPTELGTLIKSTYQNRRDVLKRLMQQAIDTGELPENTKAGIAADTMFTFMNGISVFSKNGASFDELAQICESFLAGLGFRNMA